MPLVHHLPVPVTEPFLPGVVVLEHQLSATHRVTGLAQAGQHHPPLRGQPISPPGRTRLVDLAIRVLTQSALAAEAQCRRIVADAEVQAATIVADAHAEVARLTSWLEADEVQEPTSAAHPSFARPAEVTVARTTPLVPAPPLPAVPPVILAAAEPASVAPVAEMADPESDLANEFFEFAPSSPEDAWGFLDDELVAVGPSFLKIMRRRPPARRRTTEQRPPESPTEGMSL